MKNTDTAVILSVGGSLIVPDAIDLEFVRALRELLRTYAAEGKRFIVVTGGGKTSRNYQRAAAELSPITKDENDDLGIGVTRLNAHFMALALKDIASQKLLGNPEAPFEFTHPVHIGAGWDVGASTDIDSVFFAATSGAKRLINLSNIDYAYTADPKKDPTATPIKETTWKEFRKILPDEWTPGTNTPFDPVAAKKAEELGLEVVIMNGKKLDQLENYLGGREFVGTVIR